MSTPKFIEIQKSFSDLKIQTKKYLACIQKNSLLPFATCCCGVIIGIMQFYIFLISIVSLGIGIAIKFVLPRYDLLNIIKKRFYNDSSSGQRTPSDIEKDLMKKGVEIIEFTLKFVFLFGNEHFILGIISIISCLIMLIAIGRKLQIIFFGFLLVFFILGCFFIEFGAKLWPFLLVKLKAILTFAILDSFNWDMCGVCDWPSLGPGTLKPSNIMVDAVIIALKMNYDCCGVDSPEDFGKKANNNQIPFYCCLTNTTKPGTVCDLSHSPPGCLSKLTEKIEKYKLYIDLYTAAYVVCGLLLFSIVIIGILQTIYFYLSGSHKTDLIINE